MVDVHHIWVHTSQHNTNNKSLASLILHRGREAEKYTLYFDYHQ